MSLRNEIDMAKKQLKQKENIARAAKLKGMVATYNNYMEDVSELKDRIKRLKTMPKKIIA